MIISVLILKFGPRKFIDISSAWLMLPCSYYDYLSEYLQLVKRDTLKLSDTNKINIGITLQDVHTLHRYHLSALEQKKLSPNT